MTEAIKKTIKDSAAVRWLVLILISGLIFSTYWFQDFYGGLIGLMESELGFTSEEFGRMIGLTTIANMFGMIIVGGIILDKWGVRIAGLLFGGIAVVGGVISALASSGFFGTDHGTMLNMMIVGRIFFGSGLEVVCVVATRTVVKWFKGYELALAMAINMGFGRLGSAMGIALSGDIAGGDVSVAVTFAATLIAITLLFFILYLIFDIKLDRQLKNGSENEREEEEEFKFSDLIKLISNKSFLYIALLCVSFYAAVFPFIQYAPDLLINKFNFTSELIAQGNIVLFGSATLGNASVYLVFFLFAVAFSVLPGKIANNLHRKIFLAIVLVAFVGYIWGIHTQLQLWFNNGQKTASLIPVGTILFTPIFGNYVDKKGKAASLMILGALLLIFAHVSLSLFNNVYLAYAGLLSLGVAFSLVPAAMWPSVAKIVPERRLGTAYASMFTIQNWGLGLFFWGIGAILDFVNKGNIVAIRNGEANYDYTIPIFVLVISGVVSIFLAFALKRADLKQGYGLELPSSAIAPKDELEAENQI
ncbi:MAG: MFS transporter [Bacteroidales bacterium]|jgi:MFS family permease|nr:MFS transporter [Bacteroidales bacterium]